MKKLLYGIITFFGFALVGVSLAAPTSTIVNELFINALKSTPNASLQIDSTGHVFTSTNGITINGVTSSTFTLASTTYLNITALGTTFTFTNLGVTTNTGDWAGTWQTHNPSYFNPMTSLGDIIYGGASGTPTRLASSTGVLHGGATPSWSPVVESDISLSANSTNNANTSRHGFLPTLSNVSTQFLNGQGNYVVPAGTTNSYLSTTFTNVTSTNVIHNFGAHPIVDVMDANGNVMIPMSVTHNTVNDFTVTFSTSTTGMIMASVGTPQPQSVLVTSADHTASTTDYFIQENVSGKTISLPTAVGNAGRIFVITNVSTGNITASTTVSGQLIGGLPTQTLPASTSMSTYSDGTNYQIF